MKRVKHHRYLFRRNEVLYFRRAVPAAAREQFGGRTEVLKSLDTSNLTDARHSLIKELKAFEDRLSLAVFGTPPIAALEVPAGRTPSKEEIDEAVRLWLNRRMSRTVLGDLGGTEGLLEGKRRLLELNAHSRDVSAGITFGAVSPTQTTAWVVEALIEANGWQIDGGSELRRHLDRLVARGQIEASNWQVQDIQGEPRSVLDARFAPEQYRLDVERQRDRDRKKDVSLMGLFDGYIAEAKPAPATVKAWKRQLRAFVEFIGHDNANRLVVQDVVAWKEKLLFEPNADGKILSAKTVRDTYLSALRSVLNHGSANGKIATNCAAGVVVRGPRSVKLRDKGLNDAEALLILSATMRPTPAGLSPERALARRWVPWICAYTGARVNEITQVRAEDIFMMTGIWVIRITPEAGTVKNKAARLVPLHPHIIAQGFLKIIDGRKGPIFFDPARYRGGSQGNPQSKKVGEHLAKWVREIGVIDLDVQPNHGWRHRFKTQARLANMDAEIRDAIQGHSPRTEGEGYGDTLAEVAFREIKKLPAYDTSGTPKKSTKGLITLRVAP